MKTSQNKRHQATTFEGLEPRQLFAAAPLPSQAFVDSGALIVNGTNQDDQIMVERVYVNGEYVMRVSMATGAGPMARVGDFNAGSVDRIVMNGFDGNDMLTVAESVTTQGTTFNAGNGNDTMASGRARDTFNGDAGTDMVSYSMRKSALTLKLDGIANDGQSGEGDQIASTVENLAGGMGNDVLWGNNAANIFYGNSGADSINALGGSDKLYGGSGNDTLKADGNDKVYGDAGNDTLSSTGWNNVLMGGSGTDTINSAGLNDHIDTLDGGVDYICVSISNLFATANVDSQDVWSVTV